MDSYETLPIVPLRDVVVFPHMMMPFVIGRPSSTKALEHALSQDKRIFLAAQKNAANDDPNPNDIYKMGCVASIVQSLRLPDGNVKVLVEGKDRARTIEWKEDKGFYRVVAKVIAKQTELDDNLEEVAAMGPMTLLHKDMECIVESMAAMGVTESFSKQIRDKYQILIDRDRGKREVARDCMGLLYLAEEEFDVKVVSGD